jgi:hypothetical protein
MMKKLSLVCIAAFGAAAAVAACGSDSTSPAGSGTMVVQLTDAPFPTDSVKSVDVFVVRVDARQNDADSAAAATAMSDDSSSTAGWKTVATPNAMYNLLALQNGTTAVLGSAKLAAGAYNGFRLIIDPSKSSLTLKNNQVLTSTSSPNVTFPSASKSGIKIQLTKPVTVAEGGTTTLLVDFDVANSFVMRGNSLSQNGLLFKPVVKASVK